MLSIAIVSVCSNYQSHVSRSALCDIVILYCELFIDVQNRELILRVIYLYLNNTRSNERKHKLLLRAEILINGAFPGPQM